MKPSFLSSTLSISFILCVLSVIFMMILWITPDDRLLNIVISVISFYLAYRKQNPVAKEEKQDKI